MGFLIKDENKVIDLGLRVFNNQAIKDDVKGLDDEDAIRKLCNSVFGDGSVSPSVHIIHEFNNIVVKIATKVSEPEIRKILSYFADFETVSPDTIVLEYRKPIPKHVRFKWAAVGSAVSLRRVETGAKEYVNIGAIQTGITYNPITNSKTAVEDFNALVKDVAEARIQLVWDTVMDLIGNAAINSKIPSNQVYTTAGITIANFDKVAGNVGRRSKSRPIFVADREFVNHIATLKSIAVGYNMPDALKSDFYNLEVTNLGSCDAIVMPNYFKDATGSETHFPVDRGYMLSSAADKKAFKVALAGGLTQETEKDAEYGRIKLLVRQGIGIDFLYAENIGVIEDDSISVEFVVDDDDDDDSN